MVKHRDRGKSKSILDYLAQTTSDLKQSERVSSVDIVEATSSVNSSIESAIRDLAAEKKRIETNRVGEGSESSSVRDVGEVISKPVVPLGEVLDEILEKGIGVEDIKCNSDGRCIDGVSIGEVFSDKYGFRRKRGFVNTTRLPIYLDWVLEEGVVREIMPKTYVVETNLGSRAIIPEDYICEFQFRYGLFIKNYDKCINYRSAISSGDVEKKKRK